jgi:hypothetical protein
VFTPPNGASASPADSTNYFVGITMDTADVNRNRAVIPIGGTIEKVYVWVTVGGTVGSAETVSMTLRKNGADTGITFTMAWNAANPSVASATGSVTVAEGDLVNVKIVTPAWATNPTNVWVGWALKIRQN